MNPTPSPTTANSVFAPAACDMTMHIFPATEVVPEEPLILRSHRTSAEIASLPPPAPTKRILEHISCSTASNVPPDIQVLAQASTAKLPRLQSGPSVETLICVELCAGSAKLSSSLKAKGFQIVPVDCSQIHTHNVSAAYRSISARLLLLSSLLESLRNQTSFMCTLDHHAGPPRGPGTKRCQSSSARKASPRPNGSVLKPNLGGYHHCKEKT